MTSTKKDKQTDTRAEYTEHNDPYMFYLFIISNKTKTYLTDQILLQAAYSK